MPSPETLLIKLTFLPRIRRAELESTPGKEVGDNPLPLAERCAKLFAL